MEQAWCRAIPGPVALALGLAALAPAAPAVAASQGALGASSQGSITIRLSLRAPVGVSGLSDVTFEGQAAQELCLRGAARTTYTLAASGSGPGGGLSLSNGLRTIPYRVEWRSRSGTATELSAATPLAIPAVADGEDCGRAPGSGRLSVALAPADAERLRAGAPYRGVLLLLLAPD